MSEELTKVMEQVRKLLNLAAKNTNEHEAAAAAAKAQDLLTKYNLDAALVERSTGQDGKREDARTRGGFYQYQRDLWKAVAELNFCMYWTQVYFERKKHPKREWDGKIRTYERDVRQLRHRLVGRVVNTTATKVMAQYLEEAVERITRERLGNDPKQLYSKWAISFREGMTARLAERIARRFKTRLAKEEADRRAAQAETERPATGMGTALALSTYVKSEEDANYDFIHGEGASARRAARRAEWAREQAEEEAAYTAWAKANPEEAARKEKEERERAERYWRRRGAGSRGGSGGKDVDTTAYYAGRDAAEKVSLDQQVSTPSANTRIGRN